VVQIRLLDGVSAVDETGQAVDIGPAKCQAVLAALALTPRSVVSVSRLVTMVWGDDPPRTAEKTLQSYITRLRKELGERSIVRIGAAYRLDIDPAAVDVVRFQRLLDAGDVEAALAEWTGAPLAGLAAEGLAPAVQGLVEQWLGAVEAQLTHQIDIDPAAAIGQLTELVANQPFREGLCALLMTALYRVGRQADALAAYRTTRNHLVEELGVEPGPILRALEGQVLGHDEKLGLRRSGGAPTGTVTFGFADVDDATRSWFAHPHESAAAMARHEQLVRGAAVDHGGHVFSNRGSSFGVAFERPGDAVTWSRDLQAAVRGEPWPRAVEVRVRIGLHTGESDNHAGNYFGPVVNLAACLAAAGHGAQTLVSGATAALLEETGQLRELGTYRLDGVPGEQRVYQLGDGEHPPVRSTDDRRRGNLPRRSGRLIGRQSELQLIGEALAVAPVVTLVGPGGIGKTRLATAAAQVVEGDFEGGAWLVELTAVGKSSDVPRAVADVLGVHESPGRSLTEALVAALRERRALLVLDNCEHVVDGAAALVHAVVDGCPSVRLLATSRERLGLADEQLIVVGSLDPSGSGAELFRERALALDPAFDTHTSRTDIEEICRRLDGVPLAIELAAARTRTMPPADLLARLDNSLRLLTGGQRSGVGHHRTLRAAIQWSYDLVSPHEQLVLQRLSRFVGPFDLSAAEAVASADDVDALHVDELLARLVDQSMVLVEPGPFGRRFHLLESMRQFGTEHLIANGEDDAVADRHSRWCVDQVNRIHDLIAGPAEIEGVARLSELWPNLRAALEWACSRRDGQLARALVAPIAAEALVRSQTEIADWAERILAIAPPDDEDLIVFALSLAARRYWRMQDRDGFERLVQRYGAPDHPRVHHARALVYQDNDALLRWCPQVAAELRRIGDDHLAQLSDIGVPRAMLILGRLAEADERMEVLVQRYRMHGPPSLLSWTLTMLGYSADAQGDRERADRLFDESATIEVPDRTHSRNKPIEAMAVFRQGEPARALRILRSDVEDLSDNDDVYDIAGTAVAFMSLMAHLARYGDAASIEGFLGKTGLVRGPLLRSAVTDAVERIATGDAHGVDEQRDLGRALDGRQALAFMRGVLDELVLVEDRYPVDAARVPSDGGDPRSR
jgi:predicted ATPase/DNA-binding SARP family transcriptional activator